MQGVEAAIDHLLDILQVDLSGAAHLRIAGRDGHHRIRVALGNVAQHGHFVDCVIRRKSVLHKQLRDRRKLRQFERRLRAHYAQALDDVRRLFCAAGHDREAGLHLFDIGVVFHAHKPDRRPCCADYAIRRRHALGNAFCNRAKSRQAISCDRREPAHL